MVIKTTNESKQAKMIKELGSSAAKEKVPRQGSNLGMFSGKP